MSLIQTNNTSDILKKESPWGAPNKNNKQPSSNNSEDMEDLAKKFQDGLKNMFGGSSKTPDAKKTNYTLYNRGHCCLGFKWIL